MIEIRGWRFTALTASAAAFAAADVIQANDKEGDTWEVRIRQHVSGGFPPEDVYTCHIERSRDE